MLPGGDLAAQQRILDQGTGLQENRCKAGGTAPALLPWDTCSRPREPSAGPGRWLHLGRYTAPVAFGAGHLLGRDKEFCKPAELPAPRTWISPPTIVDQLKTLWILRLPNTMFLNVPYKSSLRILVWFAACTKNGAHPWLDYTLHTHYAPSFHGLINGMFPRISTQSGIWHGSLLPRPTLCLSSCSAPHPPKQVNF